MSGFAEFCRCGHLKSDHHPQYPHRCIENSKHSWEEVKKWRLFQVCSCDGYTEDRARNGLRPLRRNEI